MERKVRSNEREVLRAHGRIQRTHNCFTDEKKNIFRKTNIFRKIFSLFYSCSSSGFGCSLIGGALATFSYLFLFVFPKASWKLPAIPSGLFDI